MSNYLYEAVDAGGSRNKGSLNVLDQSEALRRIKEMGLFPTWVRPVAAEAPRTKAAAVRQRARFSLQMNIGRIKPAALTVFTRQLATLVDVGMPLLRGLRLLHEQEENREMKRIISEVARTVETGGTMSEALAQHPAECLTGFMLNMVRAGEAGGILEQVLKLPGGFPMEEKRRKLDKGKVKAAMFYPVAVMVVAAGILTLLMTYVIPKFKEVFEGMSNGRPLPAFTVFVLNVSEAFKDHFLTLGIVAIGLFAACSPDSHRNRAAGGLTGASSPCRSWASFRAKFRWRVLPVRWARCWAAACPFCRRYPLSRKPPATSWSARWFQKFMTT